MGASPPVLKILASLPVTGRLAPCRYRISKHVLTAAIPVSDQVLEGGQTDAAKRLAELQAVKKPPADWSIPSEDAKPQPVSGTRQRLCEIPAGRPLIVELRQESTR
jgi:hypothetical protein